MGGSLGLCMVRARFAGGGAKMLLYKLFVAEAETMGGGAMLPLLDAFLVEEDGAVAPAPCVAGLL